jgi:hypothetical protein
MFDSKFNISFHLFLDSFLAPVQEGVDGRVVVDDVVARFVLVVALDSIKYTLL